MPTVFVGHNNVEPGELLELYWNYYALHAEQRMKILELFIAIETVLFGVVASEFTGGNFSDRIIGLAVSIVALLCFWLDKRTTNLLHQCRVAMRALENDYMSGYPNDFKLFSNIKHNEGKLNYSKIIRSIYLFVCLIGVVIIIISFFV